MVLPYLRGKEIFALCGMTMNKVMLHKEWFASASKEDLERVKKWTKKGLKRLRQEDRKKEAELVNAEVNAEYEKHQEELFFLALQNHDGVDKSALECAFRRLPFDSVWQKIEPKLSFGDIPPCTSEDCWFQGNFDRVHEYTYSYECRFDEDVYFCSVCADNHATERYEWKAPSWMVRDFKKYRVNGKCLRECQEGTHITRGSFFHHRLSATKTTGRTLMLMYESGVASALVVAHVPWTYGFPRTIFLSTLHFLISICVCRTTQRLRHWNNWTASMRIQGFSLRGGMFGNTLPLITCTNYATCCASFTRMALNYFMVE